MRLIRYLLGAVLIFTFAGCVGGGGAKPSVDDDTRITASVTVPSDGSVNYSGTGEFAGFSLRASLPQLVGREIVVEKSDAPFTAGSYTSVSYKYTVRLDDAEADLTVMYDAQVTIPFSSTQLSAAGGTSAAVRVCTLADDAAVPHSTSVSGTYATADISFPFSFIAGYKKTTSEKSMIELKGEGYGTASNSIADPAGTLHPDTVRAVRYVQPGERVLLGVNQALFGGAVSNSVWAVSSAPVGSAAAVMSDGNDGVFIPDMSGKYTISVTATGSNGSASDTVEIFAQKYSYDPSTGSSFCYQICHRGGFASEDVTDKYGRPLFRDLVSAWSASPHGQAFNSHVSASASTACLKCHTTGFLIADRNSDGADDYPQAEGYDDTITNWSTPSSGDTHLKGVTCEACHGASSVSGVSFSEYHYKDTPMSSATCLSCHENSTVAWHGFDYSDTHDNAHMAADGNVANNAACSGCHTAEGALGRIYGTNVTPSMMDTVTGVSCAVCHDPHGETANSHELRFAGDYKISFSSGSHTAEAENSAVCYVCHTADTALPAVGTALHNTQAEMFEGIGGYTYGTNVDLSIHRSVDLTCADCHMYSGSHNMAMAGKFDERKELCQTCHAAGSVVFTDGHYDITDGRMAAFRTKLAGFADTINQKAGMSAGSAISHSYTEDSAELTLALNRAAYNYNFIISDKSFGLHNRAYAEKLIDLSMTDLAKY
jgi:hypothetical protein